MTTKGICKRLRKARLERKMTLELAGGYVGIATSTLSLIERGQIVLSVERMLTLCEVYNADPIYIFSGIAPNFNARKVKESINEALTQLSVASQELK